MTNIRPRCAISGIYPVLIAILAVTLSAITLLAEDVVVTRQQTYRGTVKSVSAEGIQFEIAGMGVITIPRNTVTQMRVEAPPAITRGIAAYERNNIREARQSLDRIVFQYKGLDVDWAAKGLVYFGRACLKSNEPKLADNAFKSFIEAYPDHDLAADARLGLAEIDLLAKNYESALEPLQEMAKEFDRQLKPPAEQIPIAAGVYVAIGKALDGQGMTAEALEAYLRVIALYPDPQYYPEALYLSALAFAALEKFDKADRMLSELADNYPEYPLPPQAAQTRAEIAARARAMAESAADTP